MLAAAIRQPWQLDPAEFTPASAAPGVPSSSRGPDPSYTGLWDRWPGYSDNFYRLLRDRGAPIPWLPAGGRPVDLRLPLQLPPTGAAAAAAVTGSQAHGSSPRGVATSSSPGAPAPSPSSPRARARPSSSSSSDEDSRSPSRQQPVNNGNNNDDDNHRSVLFDETQRRRRPELYRPARRVPGADGRGFQTAVYGHEALVRRLARVHRFEAHEGCVNAVTWNAAGNLLVSGSDDTRLCVWDVRETQGRRGGLVDSYRTVHRANIFNARFMPGTPGDARLISCSRDGVVALTQRDRGECTRLWTSDEAVKRLATLPEDPNVFYSCGEGREVRLFDLRMRPPAANSRAELEVEEPINSMDLSGWLIALAVDSLYCPVYDRRTLGGRRLQSFAWAATGGPPVADNSRDLEPEAVLKGPETVRGGLLPAPAQPRAGLRLNRLATASSPRGAGSGVLPVAVFEPQYLPFTELLGVYHITDVAFNPYNGSELVASYSGAGLELFDVRDPGVPRAERQSRFVGGPRPRPAGASSSPRRRQRQSPQRYGGGGSHSSPERRDGNSDFESSDDNGDDDGDDREEYGVDPQNGGESALPPGFSFVLSSSSSRSSSSADDDDDDNEDEADADDRMRTSSPSQQDDDDHEAEAEAEDDSDHEHPEIIRPRSPSHTPPPTPPRRTLARMPEDVRRFLPRQTYTGHANVQTVKGCGFIGPRGEYVVSGSDSGRIWIWEKTTGRVVNVLEDADDSVVNVISPHPSRLELATSGIDNDVKLWQPVRQGIQGPPDLDRLREVEEVERLAASGLFLGSMQRQLFSAWLRRYAAEEEHRSGSDASGDDRDYELDLDSLRRRLLDPDDDDHHEEDEEEDEEDDGHPGHYCAQQ